MPLIDVPTVHAVTDDEILSSERFLATASALLRKFGDRVALHVRGPGTPAAQLHRLALALSRVQEEAGGWVVVNDRLDVALATEVRGIQLRGRSLGVGDARRLGPRLAVGVSVHSVGDGLATAAEPPDWLVAGNIFATASHPGRGAQGVDLIRGLSSTGFPVIAIGGVRAEHVAELRAAGASGVAAISGIWRAPDPVSSVQLYLSSYAFC